MIYFLQGCKKQECSRKGTTDKCERTLQKRVESYTPLDPMFHAMFLLTSECGTESDKQ